MNKEEMDAAVQSLREAKELAYQLAEHIASQTESAKKAIFATGILYASLASMHGMTMHQAMGLLMEVYKEHDNFMKGMQ